MTDWDSVRSADYAPPEGTSADDLVAELSAMLRSPDPEVRDGQAYAVLATWIGRGVLSHDRVRALGEEMVERLGDDEIQARTFAPLILDCIVSAEVFDERWVAPFEHWYLAEEDLRGHDAELGWLHAVAHGSDLLATFGVHRSVEPTRMLRLGLARLLTPTTYVLRDMEDDRLGYALAATLTREELSEAGATQWLEPALTALAARPTAGIDPVVTNTLRTLRALYVLVDTGIKLPGVDGLTPVPHRDAVRARLADVVRVVTPYYL